MTYSGSGTDGKIRTCTTVSGHQLLGLARLLFRHVGSGADRGDRTLTASRPPPSENGAFARLRHISIWWRHGELHPDLRRVVPLSCCWTMPRRWSAKMDSNHQSPLYQSGAFPITLLAAGGPARTRTAIGRVQAGCTPVVLQARRGGAGRGRTDVLLSAIQMRSRCATAAKNWYPRQVLPLHLPLCESGAILLRHEGKGLGNRRAQSTGRLRCHCASPANGGSGGC